MGKPAARLGDPTAHGGVIVLGHPTVLIGGMPAARLTDMHVCPMVTGVVPHVGGPIVGPGTPTVLIGGLPAACVGDIVTCVGPPDSIIMGCPTVLIGMGGGGGGGGGAGAGGAVGAAASAAKALTDNVEVSTKEEHWLEFEFTDKAGNPISGIQYKLKDSDGKESESFLRNDGRILRDALPEGESSVEIQSLYNAKWSKETAKVGDKIELNVESDGVKDGEKITFQIWKRDISGADALIESIEQKVKGNKAKAEWEYGTAKEEKENSGNENKPAAGFSAPEYYFIALHGSSLTTRSGFLYLEDFMEIELKDEENNPLADEEYIIFAPNGEVRNGKLNSSGFTKEEKLPGGICSVRFPNLPKFKE